MARCNCSGQVCSCKIVAGDNITITGTGSANDPLVVSAVAAGSGGTVLPTGVWFPFGGSAAPAGFLMCNGQAVSRTTYAPLFAVVGTRFGAGDGATTFNVPNLIDRFPVGAGGKYGSGSSGGSDTITLVVANLPPHQHSVAHSHSINHDHANPGSGGGHTHKLFTSTLAANEVANDAGKVTRGSDGGGKTSAPVETDGSHSHNIPSYAGNSGGSSATNSGVNPTGGSQMSGTSFTNVPPYVATNYIIKT